MIDPYRSPGLTFATSEEQVAVEQERIQDYIAGGKRPKPKGIEPEGRKQMLRHANEQIALTNEYPGRKR